MSHEDLPPNQQRDDFLDSVRSIVSPESFKAIESATLRTLQAGDREAMGLPEPMTAFQEVMTALGGRVEALEATVPDNAYRRKVDDGHHHMQPVEGMDDTVSQGFGYQLNAESGLELKRESWPNNRRLTISALGGGGPFEYDYLVDTNWATVVSAGDGTEGQSMTTFHGFSYKVFSEPIGAVDDADANRQTSGQGSSFLIIGVHSVAASITPAPPASGTYRFDGVVASSTGSSRVTTSSALTDGVFDLTASREFRFNNLLIDGGSGSTTPAIGVDGVTNPTIIINKCKINARAEAIVSTSLTGGRLEVTESSFTSLNEIAVDTTSWAIARFSGCSFTDGTVGIRIAGTASVNPTVRIENCWFAGLNTTGIQIDSLSQLSVHGCWFNTGSDAISIIDSNAAAAFNPRVTVQGNIFSVPNSQIGIDLDGSGTLDIVNWTISGNLLAAAGADSEGVRGNTSNVHNSLISNNTFFDFTSGKEIVNWGAQGNEAYHNISTTSNGETKQALADIGNPVGHRPSVPPTSGSDPIDTVLGILYDNGSLSVGWNAFITREDNVINNISASTLNVADDDTSYVEVVGTTVSSNTTGYSLGSLPLGVVVASSGDIDSITEESAVQANSDIFEDSYNGTILEPITFVVTSDGATITGTLDANPSGDMTQRFSDGYSILSSGATVTLTAGTATVPKKRFVYILQSNKTTLVEADAWPAAEHIQVAEAVVQTAALVQSDGVLANRNWNNMRKGADGQGHHSHAWERLRWEHSAYRSGAAVTWTITVNAGAIDNIDLAITAAKVYQLHLQDVSEFNTTTPADILVPNDNATPYTATPDIEDLLTDSAGGSMSGKYFNLVVWCSVSSGSETERVFINLPSGSYNKQSDATNDVDGHDNYTIPSDFRGYAFLVNRITLRHQAAASGTFTNIQEVDLRGQVPNIIAGGGTAAITTEFADGNFRIFDDGDPTKELAFEVSGISPSTTRTVTMPDRSGVMAYGDNFSFTDDTELTISGGAITVTQSHHTIDTEADAATDNLATINGLVANQMYLFRAANDARTVRFQHNADNILCVGGLDISLDSVNDFVWAFSPDGSTVYVGNTADTVLTSEALTISSGLITTEQTHTLILVTGEGSADDDLIGATAPLENGVLMILTAAGAGVITVKNEGGGTATQRFATRDNDDLVLTLLGDDVAAFVYYGGRWREVWRNIHPGNWKVTHTNGSGQVQEVTVGADGQVWRGTGATSAPAWDDDRAGIEFFIDGSGSVITTGIKGWLEVPFNCTITAVRLLADQSGAIKVDIWKDTYANYPPTNADTITGGNEPEIAASGVKDEDTTLTDWTTTLSKGDILYYNVDSVTTIEVCLVSLSVNKT